MRRGSGRRAWLGLLATLFLLTAGAGHAGHVRVTRTGGDDAHRGLYQEPLATALCLDWSRPVGQSLSQPLFIDQPAPVIYHLAGPYLHKLDLSGRELGKVQLQDDRSHGFMTYWMAGPHPDPRSDVLYVPTGRLGGRYALAAVRPATLEVMGRYEVEDYIVTAPLVLDQRTPRGGNVVIVGTTSGTSGGLLIAVFDLEQGGEVNALRQRGDGWLSGSPVPLGTGGFVMGVGRPQPGAPVGNYLVGYTLEFDPIRLNSEWQLESMHHRILSSMVLDEDDPAISRPAYLYAVDRGGYVYRVQLQTGRSRWEVAPHIHGFINTSPAVGADHLYILMRWLSPHERDGDSNSPGSRYGRLAAIDKRTGDIRWTADLQPHGPYPAWGNVDPLVWANTTGRGPREVILTGDTSGHVTAWTEAGGGQGAGHPLFMVWHAPGRPEDETPLPCDVLEGPDGLPARRHSARVRLTDRPLIDESNPWRNSQGVATGMTLVRGRLLMGVNEADGSGRLMALRMGRNAGLGPVQVWVSPGPGKPLENWTDQMVRDGSGWQLRQRVMPGGEIQLRLPVRFELEPDRGFGAPVLWGWEEAAAAPQRGYAWGTGPADGSFPAHGLTLTLPVPAEWQAGMYHAAVLLNPGLYARRWRTESQRALPAGREIRPAAPPAGWLPVIAALAGDIPGEVSVLDNLFRMAVPVGAEPPTARFRMDPEQVCVGQPVRYIDLSTDPQGLPLQADWQGRRERFSRPGTYEVALRVTNAAGVASPWAFRQIEVLQAHICTPGEAVNLRAAFDPNPARRGDQVQMEIQVINAADLRDFQVTELRVELPTPLQRGTVQLGYGAAEVDNTRREPVRLTPAGERWQHQFQAPWGKEPPDGPYEVMVTANGTYTMVHVHVQRRCAAWADADGDGAQDPDEPCDTWEWVEQEHLHLNEPWPEPAAAPFRLVISGTRELVNPLKP